MPVAQPGVLTEHRQPAAAPGPVRVNGIDDGAHEHAEHGERGKFPALRQGPGGDGGRGVHEDHLEQEVGEDRRGVGDAREEEPGPPEQPPVLAPERERDLVSQLVVAAERAERADPARLEREADGPIRQHRDAVHHEVHGDGVGRVLGAGEAGLDQREAGLHEHHEEPGHQGPHEVDGDGVGGRGGVCGAGERVSRQPHRLGGHRRRTRQRQQHTKSKRAFHGRSHCHKVRAKNARFL